MLDKQLLKAIENDIKNIDEYIDTCIDDDTIHYLYLIKQDMLIFKLEILKHIFKLEILKHISIDEMLKEK